MRWINRTQSNFSESFYPVFNWRYFLFPHSPLRASKYPFANSTRTALAKGFLKGKDVTLWGEFTEHRAVSQKASFQFWTEDISFFTIALYGLPNIPLPIPQQQPLRKASWRESCNSVRWINRTQSSFSKSFFTVLSRRSFLFHHSPLWASKYHFANSPRTVITKGFLRRKL